MFCAPLAHQGSVYTTSCSPCGRADLFVLTWPYDGSLKQIEGGPRAGH